MKHLLTILAILTCGLALWAGPVKDGDAAEAALSAIDSVIARAQQAGNQEEEGEARWQRIVILKNFSLTEQQAAEAGVQMDWLSRHNQWDNYYRCWQLRANALCALGKLQTALQETQRMLDDAKARNNTLGRAMGYKQIGIIYLNMKQTEPAVEALKHYAELMEDEHDDISSHSNIFYRVAKAYDYDRNYDRELDVTDEWLHFLHDKGADADDTGLRECYNECFLARTAAYIGLGRLADAGLALDTAAACTQQINTRLSLHHYYKMSARYQLARGDAAKALLYTDSVSLATSEKDDHTAEVRAQALMMLGRGAEAARIYQRLYHEKDSVFGRDARQHLDELNTIFHIDELKTEQQRTKFRYTLLMGCSVVLALLVLLLYGWHAALRQKKANEQLRLANERAMTSSKMKTEFIRNISHEIRTPLNIIAGFTQVLTTPGMELPDEEKADVNERISENTERITKLVDRMLELSDINSEALIERNDHTCVREIVELAIAHSGIAQHTRPANAQAAVTFSWTDSDDAALTLRTNTQLAVRMLAQLLENAAKFTHEGSITLHTENSDDSICFIVQDTGIGIPKEHTDSIFDEFVQLNQFADGTGIGLTVARSMARRMGGDLWLDAGNGKGARFVVRLLKA